MWQAPNWGTPGTVALYSGAAVAATLVQEPRHDGKDEFDAVGDADLQEQPGHVVADGVDGEAQVVCDLLVGAAAEETFDDVALAGRKRERLGQAGPLGLGEDGGLWISHCPSLTRWARALLARRRGTAAVPVGGPREPARDTRRQRPNPACGGTRQTDLRCILWPRISRFPTERQEDRCNPPTAGGSLI